MEKYVHPFIDACEDVFRKFVGTELFAERPFFSHRDDVYTWDISSVINFTGEAKGAVVISMKKDLAAKITAALTGNFHEEVNEETVDAIGEIINIIAGNAKKGLEDAFRLKISLPTIIQGTDYSISWPSDKTRVISIPFKIYDKESFCLSVAIESTGAKEDA